MSRRASMPGAAALLALCSCAAPPLPPATGPWSDVRLISDLAADDAVLALVAVLTSPAPDLLPEEPRFQVVRQAAVTDAAAPRDKNVIIVTRSDGPGASWRTVRAVLPRAERARVDAGEALWCALSDVWARRQDVHVLVGPAARLDSLLLSTAVPLRTHLESSCVSRALDAVRADTATAAAQALRRRHSFVVAVPVAYQVVEPADAAAVELVCPSPTRSVTIFWRDAVDAAASQSDRTLLAVQRQVLARLHGDSLALDRSWVGADVRARERRLLRGTWENRAEVASGPLLTIFVYDAPGRRLYGVQGQLFAPGQRKRSMLIELEAIMRSFRLESTP